MTGGAPVSVRVERLRLYPIDLRAEVTIEGLDLAMARVYLPPDAPLMVDGGRGSTSVHVSLDSGAGLRLDGTARVEDVVLTRRGGEPLARVPTLTTTLEGLHFGPGGMAIGRLAVDGSAAVVDPSAPAPGRYAPTTIRARVADLTWPVTMPAAVDLSTRVEGRGSLSVAGTLKPPAVPSELRVRLEGLDLAPWGRFAPLSGQVTGVAEADLRINEPLRVGVPSRVQGTIAVADVGLTNGRERLLHARRVEASGLELDWPERLRIRQVAIRQPRAVVERDPAGGFPLARLGSPPAPAALAEEPAPAATAPPPPRPTPRLAVGEVVVQDGTVEWRDRAVAPPVHVTLSGLTASVAGAGWPATGPLELRVTGRPTGGGQMEVSGRVGLTPLTVDARVTAQVVALASYQPYLSPDVPVTVDEGRGSASVHVSLDSGAGLRLDGTARVEDVVLTRRGGEPLARVPTLTTTLEGLHFGPGGMALARLAVDGSAAVVDPSAPAPGRYAPTTIRARVADLTWPVTMPAAVDLSTRVEGRGSLSVAGTLKPPAVPSELRVRLEGLDLAPWARFAPLSGQVTGVAEADLRINEPLRVGVPSRVQGTIAVADVGLTNGRERLLHAQRVEASGLELDWPERLRITQLAVRQPRAVVERDPAGGFPLARLGTPPRSARPLAPVTLAATAAPPSQQPVGVAVGEVVVQDGTVEWRDQAVNPPVHVTLAGLTVTVAGAGWPAMGPLELRAAGRPTGGGELEVSGRVGLTPLTADARVTTRAVDLAPYQPYLPTPARVSAWADLDLAVAMGGTHAIPTARGSAALSRVDIRDGERTVLQVKRAAVTGLEVEWPRRIAAARLALEAPWGLVERDERGAMGMRSLLPAEDGRASPPARAVPAAVETPRPLAVSVAHVEVDGGGARVVDRSVSPRSRWISAVSPSERRACRRCRGAWHALTSPGR